MAKSVFTDAHVAAHRALADLRKSAGLTQVELAQRLGKPQQFVSQIEQGIRRVDIVEFYAITKAMGLEPDTAFQEVTKGFPDTVSI